MNHLCHKQFLNKSTQRVHAGEKPHTCDICHKGFSLKSNLKAHHRVHTAKEPYACYICHNEFSDKTTLSRHHRLHTGEKTYACDMCPKGFSKKGSLKMHHRIHTGKKQYACSVCHKQFSKKEQVTQYQLLDAGEKAYACDAVCNRIGNPSYMDSDGDETGKRTSGVEASLSISQSSPTAAFTHGNFLSGMKESVSIGKEIFFMNVKALDCANKAVDDAKIVVEMMSKILNDANSKSPPLPGSDTFYLKILEESRRGMKEGLSIAKEILVSKVNAVNRAKEDVDAAKFVLKMKLKLLDDAKRDSEVLEEHVPQRQKR